MGCHMQRDAVKSRSLTLWQSRAFFSMAVLYLFYYFGKKNIGWPPRPFEDTFGFSHE